MALVLGPPAGLGVEVFDKDALVALGCGGLLGVNMGSDEPPRMIKLTYTPAGTDGRRRPRPATWRWSARGSCTTRAGSASSRRTRCTRR